MEKLTGHRPIFMLSDDELPSILLERDESDCVYQDAEDELSRRDWDRSDASSGTVPS